MYLQNYFHWKYKMIYIYFLKKPSHDIKSKRGERKGPQDEFLLVRDLHLNLVLCAAAK